MIKKLQRKFIMISGLSMIIIMVCFLTPVNLINRMRVGDELERTLRLILESDGDFSDLLQTEPDAGKWPEKLGNIVGSDDLNLTPESRFQLRYFIVTILEDGTVTDRSLSHIAAINEDEAASMALGVLERGRDGGFVMAQSTGYYYLKKDLGDGKAEIGFLDCTREINNLQIFAYVSVVFALLLIALYTVVMAVLSRKVMQPYIDNIESQREFITNAGHELKTPLAIISANTEVIEMINGKSEWTDSIMTQVKRGTSLINDLITLSRATEAEQVVLTDVDISAILSESAESFRPVLEKDEKRLEAEIQEGVHVKAERKMVMQLCNILIDNAAKYCDEKGTVRVMLKKRGRSGAQMTVSNDYREGSGMDYSRFFRRFYRGDVSHNSKKSGYGIGLSMAQTITEKLKGNITAHWKNGVITFSVTI